MVRILTDSTSDLTKELLEELDITVLPLHILLGENEYEDGANIIPEDIYAWSDANNQTPKTSAPGMDRTMDILGNMLEKSEEIICFSISDTMSTSGNVMRLAAQNLKAEDRITVIDSKNLSTGIGHLVVEAALMAKQGMNAAEITAKIEELRPRVRASFVVDTLVFLHRGGRCSGLAALLGGALKLHPRIQVADGVMHAGKKYRGKMDNVIMNYVKDMEPALKTAKRDRVFITHSGCSAESVESVREYLEGLEHFDEIIETRAGGVISSHCGPGTLGVLFIAGEE